MMYSWLMYLLLDHCIDSFERECEFKLVDLGFREGRKFSRIECDVRGKSQWEHCISKCGYVVDGNNEGVIVKAKWFKYETMEYDVVWA